MTTTDSNLWGGASGHTYTFTPRPDGKTDLDAVVIREGKNFKGRALGLALSSSARASWDRRSQRRSRQSRPGRFSSLWEVIVESNGEPPTRSAWK